MKNKFKMIAALIVAVAIAATGTFAWQKIVKATNEFTGNKKEITVHDDFDPDEGLKDVYVENRGSATIYVRIKLDETMNLTDDTWRPKAGDWVTHTYGADATDCGHTNKHDGKHFHDYFKWTMGGWKYYMPGSAAQSVLHDTNKYNGTEEGVEKTPDAKIITSAEFLAMTAAEQKAFIGWIYSEDGYAYWSQPLHQGEATGLLLHGVEKQPPLEDLDYYYAINVIVEVVDRRDIPMWTQGAASVDESGATHQEASPDGKEVIAIIAGPDPDPGQPTLAIQNHPNSVVVGNSVMPPTVTVGPPGAPNSPLIWASSDESIAAVDENGVVTGVAVGFAEISVTAPNGLTLTYTIEVVSGAIHAVSVAIDGGDKTIDVGDKFTPGVTVTPSNSTDDKTWTSSDPGIASVDLDTGEITGIAPGEAVITVTVGGKSDSITVTVTNPSGGAELPVNKPADGFTPDPGTGGPSGDGYYAKFNFEFPTPEKNEVYHFGAIHLEDIITDGIYTDVTATALDAKYIPYIEVGIDHHGKPSVLFSYRPTEQEWIDWTVANGTWNLRIPVQVLLARDDGKSAVITINMHYYGCLVTFNPD
jgi:hypothetical protein